MDSALPYLIGLIVVAVAFDFLNGLHDAANSIATIVSTRVLRPHYAVFWAAFFNFIAFLFFGLHVAQTVGTGIVTPDIIDDHVIFGALMGAICWNVLTWIFGIPSSSSHALIGGLVGAGIAKADVGSIVWRHALRRDTPCSIGHSPRRNQEARLTRQRCAARIQRRGSQRRFENPWPRTMILRVRISPIAPAPRIADA